MITETERRDMLHVHFNQLLNQLGRDCDLSESLLEVFFNYFVRRTDLEYVSSSELTLTGELLDRAVYQVNLWINTHHCSDKELAILIEQTDFYKMTAK